MPATPDRPTQQVQVTPRTAIGFLRERAEKSLPIYQGDIDSALAEARAEAARSVPVAEGLRRALVNCVSALTITVTNVQGSEPHWCSRQNGHEATCSGMLIVLRDARAALAATPPDPAEGQEPAVIDADGLAQILGEHERWDALGSGGDHECACGRWHNWKVGGDDPALTWADHVASMILARLSSGARRPTYTAVERLDRPGNRADGARRKGAGEPEVGET